MGPPFSIDVDRTGNLILSAGLNSHYLRAWFQRAIARLKCLGDEGYIDAGFISSGTSSDAAGAVVARRPTVIDIGQDAKGVWLEVEAQLFASLLNSL